MNPKRLHALFNARVRMMRDTGNKEMNTDGKKTRFVDLDVPAGNEKSLAQYFLGR